MIVTANIKKGTRYYVAKLFGLIWIAFFAKFNIFNTCNLSIPIKGTDLFAPFTMMRYMTYYSGSSFPPLKISTQYISKLLLRRPLSIPHKRCKIFSLDKNSVCQKSLERKIGSLTSILRYENHFIALVILFLSFFFFYFIITNVAITEMQISSQWLQL